MRSAAVIVSFAFVVEIHAKELWAHNDADAQDFMNKLVDSLVLHGVKAWPFHKTDLDTTILAKPCYQENAYGLRAPRLQGNQQMRYREVPYRFRMNLQLHHREFLYYIRSQSQSDSQRQGQSNSLSNSQIAQATRADKADSAVQAAQQAQSAHLQNLIPPRTNQSSLPLTAQSSSPFATQSSSSGPAALDPFAPQSSTRAVAAPTEPDGFLRDDVDRSTLLSTQEADRLLRRFDRAQMEALKNGTWDQLERGDPACTHPPLRMSCRSLVARSSRVMMGICAPDAFVGIASLKAWVTDLGLPRGKLQGMDVNGKPMPPPEGAVFIKYNSDSGDAYLSGYLGACRGVLLTPTLIDGEFRQFGYLPLDLPAGGCGDSAH